MSSPDPLGAPATRDRILQATWDLIEKTATTPRLADIARAADVSRQTVYLHFGDRSGLLAALVDYISEAMGKPELVDQMFASATGIEALDFMVDALSIFQAKVDHVTRALESAQYQDPSVAEAWRELMNTRRSHARAVVQRIADEGDLAECWDVETAATFFYMVAMPGPWRELVRNVGWSPNQWAERTKQLIHRGLLRR